MYKYLPESYNDNVINYKIIHENYIDIPNNEIFIQLYDNNHNKINVILVSRPFESDNDYKIYLSNKHDHIFLGISSFQEFPGQPLNSHESWRSDTNPKGTIYFKDMYKNLFDGWLHCFLNPSNYFDISKPYALISESDFVNYETKIPPNIPINEREYDYVYVCTRTDWSIKNPDESSCYDWTSINKNWPLAKKCLPILSGPIEKGGHNLKGLLIGRKGCDIDKSVKHNIKTTLHMNYQDLMNSFKKCKFIFIPNVHDASPRIITEAMSHDTRILINKNIVGGWKYADHSLPESLPKAGELFNGINDLSQKLKILLNNMESYEPRQQIIKNYGPINSGKKLKKFLFDNFKDKIKSQNDFEYIMYPRWKP